MGASTGLFDLLWSGWYAAAPIVGLWVQQRLTAQGKRLTRFPLPRAGDVMNPRLAELFDKTAHKLSLEAKVIAPTEPAALKVASPRRIFISYAFDSPEQASALKEFPSPISAFLDQSEGRGQIWQDIFASGGVGESMFFFFAGHGIADEGAVPLELANREGYGLCSSKVLLTSCHYAKSSRWDWAPGESTILRRFHGGDDPSGSELPQFPSFYLSCCAGQQIKTEIWPPQTFGFNRLNPVWQTLSNLDELARRGEGFGLAAIALERLVREESETVRRLQEVIVKRESHARVRWFILETLAKYARSARLTNLLIEALQEWPAETDEGMALLGAVIALRNVKVPAESRETVRAALVQRLQAKRDKAEWRGDIIGEQIVGQLLAGLGSFAQPSELELFRDFWTAHLPLPLSLNSLDGAKRTARRTRREPLTGTFFQQRHGELRDWLITFPRTGSMAEESAAVFWALAGFVAARQAAELQLLVDVAREHPTLGRQLYHEAVKARQWLQERDPSWLKEQVEGEKAFGALGSLAA